MMMGCVGVGVLVGLIAAIWAIAVGAPIWFAALLYTLVGALALLLLIVLRAVCVARKRAVDDAQANTALESKVSDRFAL